MELLPLGKVLPTPLHTPRVTHGLRASPTPVTNSTTLNGVVGVLVMGNWNFRSTFWLSLFTAFARWHVYMCEWTPRPRGEALSLLSSAHQKLVALILIFRLLSELCYKYSFDIWVPDIMLMFLVCGNKHLL